MRPGARSLWVLGLPLLLAPASAAAKGCHERSEIVGKQRCARFGDGWDVSSSHAWVVGLGPTVAHFPVAGVRFSGSVAESYRNDSAFRLRGDGLGTWTSVAPTLRLTLFPARVFYVGAEGQAGAGFVPEAHPGLTSDAPGPAVALPPALAVHTTGFSFRSLGVVAGVSVPVWRFDVSAEVLGGFRALSLGLAWDDPRAATTASGGCWMTPKGTACPSVDGDWTFLPHVEPRVGVALRVHPWLTLRALVGFDPFAGGAVSASALLEIHLRSYDGFYARRIGASAEGR